MNTHEQIRALLPLAAFGLLSREETILVDQHVRACGDCRHELDSWGTIAIGLKHLPQPAVPVHLIVCTQVGILREHDGSDNTRIRIIAFVGLSLLSWVVNLLMWKLAQELSGGRFDVLGMNLVAAGPWFLVSFVVCGTAAIAAAISLKEFSSDRRTF